MKYPRNPEGFRNPNDIFDQPSTLDVEKEEKEADEKSRRERQIRFHFDTSKLTDESEQLLAQWEKGILACLEAWSKEIKMLLRQDKRISPRMREYLETKGMDLPTFDIYAHAQADEVLKKFGFTKENIKKDNLFVVFNLPKPLSQFWWKGGVDSWGTQAKDVQEMVIEWGRIYRFIIPVVWDAIDDSVLDMRRINPYGVHDPKQYYYLWEATMRPAV